MADAIRQQKCHNHATREASGRCMDCRKMFCKECVSPFEGRLLCAACLAAYTPPAAEQRGWGLLAAPLQVFVGICALWFVFNAAANLLIVVPSTFFDIEQSWRQYDPYLPEEPVEDEESP